MKLKFKSVVFWVFFPPTSGFKPTFCQLNGKYWHLTKRYYINCSPWFPIKKHFKINHMHASTGGHCGIRTCMHGHVALKWVPGASLQWQNKEEYGASHLISAAHLTWEGSAVSLSANTSRRWLSVNCSTLAGAGVLFGWWQWKSSGLRPARIKTQQKQLRRQRRIISRCVFLLKVLVWPALAVGSGGSRADVYSIGLLARWNIYKIYIRAFI